MSRDAQVWLCLLGPEGRYWIYLVIDEVEWTKPRYGHQSLGGAWKGNISLSFTGGSPGGIIASGLEKLS